MKNLLVALVVSLVLLTALVIACDQTSAPTPSPAPEPTQGLTPHPSTPSLSQSTINFTLSTSVSPEGTGSVSPLGGEYQQGNTIKINATPSDNYIFTHWSGDVSTVGNVNAASTTITMDDNYAITANFYQVTYTLTTKSTSGGSITTPGEGTYTYSEGTSVKIIATADTGYAFTRWSDDVNTVDDVKATSTTTVTFINITMDSDKTIVAHFTDAAPPVISEVAATDVSDTSVTINWATSEPATSQVEYGKTADYELTISLGEKLVTSHSVALRDLEPSTTYHFTVKSKDANENEAKSKDYTFTTRRGPTKVGGVLSKGTGQNRYEITWTAYESPYEITETIQIPEDITLTIEPGVIVNKPTSGDMFLLMGTINAQGTEKEPIVFDGGGNSIIIGTYGDQATGELEYCVFQNGSRLWYGSGAFNLRHSQIVDLTPGSGSAYSGAIIESHPAGGEINIEYNRFVNTGGIYFRPDSEYGISIKYNLFQGLLSPLCNAGGIMPETFAYYKDMVVKYNSFIDIKGTVLSLGFESLLGLSLSYPIDATQNYWGTTDRDVIDLKIHDSNDDIRIGSTIEYQPILESPHPDTPSPD